MRTESVAASEVRLGDVIQDPAGENMWRRVEDLVYDSQARDDGSGEFWQLYAFIGPMIDPAAASSTVVDGLPGADRFIFREDDTVTRRAWS
ncbi:hypothetical protein [Nocardia sp. NPDC050793]|uniref:hypothetical protein n=1 Tax=Nocardia sp. NPDC050793 TaxID=3155159 RepID=UPI00340E8F03